MNCLKETDYVDIVNLQKKYSRRMVVKQIQHQLKKGIGFQTSRFLANIGVEVMDAPWTSVTNHPCNEPPKVMVN